MLLAIAEKQTVITVKPFVIGAKGLIVNGSPTFKEWYKFGKRLYRKHQAIQWAIGDWINYGESHYGEKYSQALDTTNYSYDWLRQIASLATTYNPCSREHKRTDGSPLPITHYRAVASFPEPVRTQALQIAATQDLDRDETRKVALNIVGKTMPPHWEKIVETEETEFQHMRGKFKVVVWKWVE